MPLRNRSSAAFALICAAALPMLSACADASRWRLTIDKVGPTYVPAIDINGNVQRLAAFTVTGSPTLIAPLLQRVQADGWKARLVGEDCIEFDPVGHSMDEVVALNFRVENGEFGDLKFNVLLRPDKKARG